MMLLKLAWRNIWRNKKRTWITIASIFFSVILAYLMRSMQEGAYDSMVNNVAGFYSGHAQIQHKDYWEKKSLEETFIYTDSLKQLLRENDHPQLKQFVPRLESFALASSGELTKGAMILGIDPAKEAKLMNPEKHLSKGAYLNKKDNSLLLAQGLAKNIKVSIGDTVVLLGKGYHGVTAAGKYPVKGLVDVPSPDLNKRLAFLPLKQAQYLFGCEGRLTSIALMANDHKNLQSLTNHLKSKLGDKYSVMTWQEMNPALVQGIEADRGGGLIMLAILYIVIGFGIFGTVIMMTLERKREFAILLGIGMHRLQLAFVTFMETVMIAFTGTLAGLIGGLPIVTYFYFNPIPLSGQTAEVTKSFGIEPVIPFSMDSGLFISQALIVLIIALVTAIYPFTNVMRLKVVDAMSS